MTFRGIHLPLHHRPIGTTRWAAAVIVGVCLGCGSKPSTSSSRGPVVAVSPAPEVSVTEADNGRTIAIQRGGIVTLVLHSTYWTVTGTSNVAILAPLSAPSVVPVLQGCVPGQGCGMVTVRYRAVTPGSTVLSAGRTTCGEARVCSAAQQSYRVVVNVMS